MAAKKAEPRAESAPPIDLLPVLTRIADSLQNIEQGLMQLLVNQEKLGQRGFNGPRPKDAADLPPLKGVQCPQCGGGMQWKRRHRDGAAFAGCVTFPSCRCTMNEMTAMHAARRAAEAAHDHEDPRPDVPRGRGHTSTLDDEPPF